MEVLLNTQFFACPPEYRGRPTAFFTKFETDSKYRYLMCSEDKTCFILDDYFSLGGPYFHRLCIYNDKIYSTKCIYEKYNYLPIDIILKDHLNEIEDCEIENYLIQKQEK